MLPAAPSDEGEQHADRVSARLVSGAVQEPTPATAALSSLVQPGCLVGAESGSGVPDEAAVSRATVGLGASFCDHCARDSLSRPGVPLAGEPTIAQRGNPSRCRA
jgi:hypothetical protein